MALRKPLGNKNDRPRAQQGWEEGISLVCVFTRPDTPIASPVRGEYIGDVCLFFDFSAEIRRKRNSGHVKGRVFIMFGPTLKTPELNCGSSSKNLDGYVLMALF